MFAKSHQDGFFRFFNGFSSVSDKGAAVSTVVANELTTFSSQKEMQKALSDNQQAGLLCCPLTNLYVQDTNGLLTKSNLEVFKASLLEEKHQDALREQGLDGKHSAFVDTKTPYVVKKIPVESISEITEQTVLPIPGHSIITYPINGSVGRDPYHQVYLGKLNEGRCVSFDSDRQGSKKSGNCPDLLKEILESVSTKADDSRPPKRVTIASTSLKPSSSQDNDDLSGKSDFTPKM
jgi:hypothetical protein